MYAVINFVFLALLILSLPSNRVTEACFQLQLIWKVWTSTLSSSKLTLQRKTWTQNLQKEQGVLGCLGCGFYCLILAASTIGFWNTECTNNNVLMLFIFCGWSLQQLADTQQKFTDLGEALNDRRHTSKVKLPCTRTNFEQFLAISFERKIFFYGPKWTEFLDGNKTFFLT